MRRLAALALSALLFGPSGARADEIVLGTAQPGLGFPWPFGSGLRFQQVFDSSIFGGTINITGIEFFNQYQNSAEGYVEPTTYRFSFSTTAVSSATLAEDFEGNLGPSVTPVLEWTVPDYSTDIPAGTSLTLAWSTPFFYDPRLGNLLFDVNKGSTTEDGDGPVYIDGRTEGQVGTSLAGHVSASPRGTHEQVVVLYNAGIKLGLIGDFTPIERPGPAPVPEPATLLLLGGGLAAAACRRRKRK